MYPPVSTKLAAMSFWQRFTRFMGFLGIIILLNGCHSEYVCLDYEVYHGPRWDEGHSRIAFAASQKAWRSAEGIARFPDGGTPEYILEELGIFIFNPGNGELSRIVDLNDLAAVLGTSRGKLTIDLVLSDSLLYYRITPTTQWHWYLKWARTPSDSLTINSLQKKYHSPGMMNIHSGEVSKIDSQTFLSVKKSIHEDRNADLTSLNNHLKDIPLKHWGLVIQQIYPKPDDAYIRETILLENRCALSRRAVIEQIISRLSAEQIEQLLEQMDDHKNQLPETERMEYERYAHEIYLQLRRML